ncbi:addiction module toxin, HicA family [candidate division WOR-3 bacterium]|nr:addiction module toxin, HicA family [candidate division WOR-3 bacterium]
MTRLPVLTPAELVRVLLQKGFVLDRSKGSHRVYLNPETRRRAVIPFHTGSLPKGTFREILRQAGISKEELADLL